MRKLTAYNFLTLNGFFKGPNEDTNWHTHGEEEAKYSEEALEQDNNILLFGRKTYEMMANFWPTPQAKELFPKVAEGMNKAEKIVCSESPFEPAWQNTQVISGDIVAKIRAIKKSPGKDMTILGSGALINLLTDHGLIDEYQFMIDPVALPDGTPVFKNIKQKLELRLTGSKVFKSGVVLLNYQPINKSIQGGRHEPSTEASHMSHRIQTTKEFYKAFATGDRSFVEEHLTDDFTFSAPSDPHLDRASYFIRCWPGAGKGQAFEFIRLIESGDEVIVTYESKHPNGTKGRNTEILTFDGDKICKAEVYFGWNIG